MKVAGGAVGVAAFAQAMAPIMGFADGISMQEMLQDHYKRLTDDDKSRIFKRLEEEARRKYGAEVRIRDPQPMENVKFGYALNLSVCIGCRQCVKACRIENNHNRKNRGSYIRVFEMDKASMELAQASSSYEHPVRVTGRRYMPIQCHQCDKPPCVDVCPVKATWKEPDGIVVIDYNWCIGCRYCEAACPYHARFFNWTDPEIPAEEVTADQGYLSNRIRPRGVMEKCTFCLHRTREGRLPACLEACPAGARVFGNLLDPNSEIRWVLENKRVYVLKEEQGTQPSFYYFFSE
jgi:molybdopterin-containing oxidoreductase family iron-sulfur binding subunit